jgi:hypothetical protein
MIERLLFKRVELWVLLLILFTGIVIAIWFGWRVSKLERSLVLGRVDRLVMSTAGLPDSAAELYSSLTGPPNADLLAWSQRFPGEGGLEFNYAPGTRPNLGYVLINRFDGDAGRSVSELVDLNAQELVHRWSFDVDEIWSELDFESSITDLAVDRGNGRFRAHSLLLKDGSLVVQDFSPLLRFDHCGRLLWAQEMDIFHHSLEADEHGNLWVPITIEPKTVDLGGWGFEDSGIAQLDLAGNVVFSRSVVNILDKNGLGMYVYGQGRAHPDPIHVNDIQPVMKDGGVWRKGDVFISSRHKSMVFLYRPKTNEILWKQIGPWTHQHDVDILDDRRIAIFDNRARTRLIKRDIVPGTNDWIVLDLVNGDIQRPFHEGFEKLDIRTPIEGLAELATDSELMVEETMYGRLVTFDRSGNILWQFINRAQNGNIYKLSWSRLVPRELGDAVRGKIAEEPCNG